MNVQLKQIILFLKNGKIRILSFELNTLNIITGGSKTGKSALIHIVNYCMAASKSSIPAGVIPNNTLWYGIILSKKSEEIFIARKNPKNGYLTSEEIYIERGKRINIENNTELSQNINLEGLTTVLNEFCNITEYSHELKPNQTRQTGLANISKALIYCFQEQGEIANKNLLFHRQGEPFLPQSIKDYMPYFLGAVSLDFLAKQDELKKLKIELNKIESEETKNFKNIDNEVSTAHSMITEAISAGLLDQDTEFSADFAEIKQILLNAIENINENRIPESQSQDELNRLNSIHNNLREEYKKISEDIEEYKNLQLNASGYSNENREQKSRLESIGLIPEKLSLNPTCPLCNSKLNKKIPTVIEINKNLRRINQQLDELSSDLPHLQKLINRSAEKKEILKNDLNQINQQIISLKNSTIRIQEFNDQQNLKNLVRGRISYYYDTIKDFIPNKPENSNLILLKEKISNLETQIENESIDQKLNSILSLISSEISKAAKNLKLEHSEYPFRFDLKKLTVVADTKEGPIPMNTMGSGENWVSIHLITYLVFHKWFAEQKLPIPNFIFFDQPTQAFFPPQTRDKKVKNTDNISVIKMFKLLESFVKNAGFQIILTDHADLPYPWYQKHVVEKWWDGKLKLIPTNLLT
ncbi:hypothetical protein LPTSP4_36030 [Leptospira ryugenii]|uniref:Rad50/SbcC-type AAA domain-containing protein n=1 Tax=Leptospira ryugenii TaxID=1917863 RepID=A0A2P2E5A0_9LEPT|nr:DUF3732 domain-containing protein [Leptospira ryugenii]GBF52065.1 hypothetical protein LPTSP4_36030 [Leptospira ryugenii]